MPIFVADPLAVGGPQDALEDGKNVEEVGVGGAVGGQVVGAAGRIVPSWCQLQISKHDVQSQFDGCECECHWHWSTPVRPRAKGGKLLMHGSYIEPCIVCQATRST